MNVFKNMYEWIHRQEAFQEMIEVESLPSPEFVFHNRSMTSFSSNNYLALAAHPEMIKAARQGLETFGVGNCESRLLGGDLSVYRELERRLAALKQKESAVLFATGYLTNLGALSAFANCARVLRPYGYRVPGGHKLAYFSDQFNHLSIREGIASSAAERFTYPHLDMNRLEALLKKSVATMRIIVTDGVFSQDGDIAPLPDLMALADLYDAYVYVDDAHGTGVLGQNGGGISEHFKMYHPRMIHMGTLSKAYGGIGGFVAAEKHIVELLRITSSAYGFTSTLPPDQAFAIIRAMELVVQEPERRTRLWNNQRYFSDRIRQAGFHLISSATPILPVLVGDEAIADAYSRGLHAYGFHVDSVKFPAVGLGQARLRFIVNANHTRDQIDRVIAGMMELRDQLAPRIAGRILQTQTAL